MMSFSDEVEAEERCTPLVMSYSSNPLNDEEKLCQKGDNLLKSVPWEAGEASVFWGKLRSMDLVFMKKFWVLADPDEPDFDLQKVHFTEWTDQFGRKCAGMRDE